MIEGNVIKLCTGDILVEVGNNCITLKQLEKPNTFAFIKDGITLKILMSKSILKLWIN